jgi:hypothetical protein
MKGKYLLRGIGGFVLSALLILGVSMSSAGTVNAQRGFHRGGFHGGGFHSRVFIGPRFGYGPYWNGYGPYGYPYSYYSRYVFGDSQAADSQGYEDGLKTGSDDARHNRSNNPERSHYFKDAGFGNFAQDYRAGFERGYSAGFSS